MSACEYVCERMHVSNCLVAANCHLQLQLQLKVIISFRALGNYTCTLCVCVCVCACQKELEKRTHLPAGHKLGQFGA